MTDDSGYHSGDGGNGFKEDGTVKDLVLSDFTTFPSGRFDE